MSESEKFQMREAQSRVDLDRIREEKRAKREKIKSIHSLDEHDMLLDELAGLEVEEAMHNHQIPSERKDKILNNHVKELTLKHHERLNRKDKLNPNAK